MNFANQLSDNKRVVSGMRPTGNLHLGHYHGVLKNWIKLQHEYKCFFFVADWHALTTQYENPHQLQQNIWEMVIDWLAVGVDPGSSTIFVQSKVPEHAELALLLGMMTPISWLERVPTYKDQQEKLRELDLSTYGFLGYPLLQSADILVYKAGNVPVGEDQVSHVELTREVARRFNNLYGKDLDFENKAEAAIARLGKKNAKLYRDLKRRYQEQGDGSAIETAKALIAEHSSLSIADKERLLGYLEGLGKIILPEPQALLNEASKLPGLDGQKMSKSYSNYISLRDTKEEVNKKIRTMPTDPARVRRTDPGDPVRCPVWQFHQVYSSESTQNWVQQGCRSAGIGCLECKQPVIDAVNAELEPIQEKISEFKQQPDLVRGILAQGADEARDEARKTMEHVREAMSLE